MHWLQFVTPTPHFISTAPPPLKNVYTVLCICVFVLIQYMYMYQ